MKKKFTVKDKHAQSKRKILDESVATITCSIAKVRVLKCIGVFIISDIWMLNGG